MHIERTWTISGGLILLVAILLWTGFELTPGRCLERRQDRLLQAAGDRNWKRVRELMAEDYRDVWGQDREEAVTLASEGLANFLALEIFSEDTAVDRRGGEATVSALLRLRGRGNAVGEAIISRANSLESHFRFAWTRKSWKPWDWKLVSVSQPEIDTMWTP
jgi:hypothetical protein